jgi:hypothetical protein
VPYRRDFEKVVSRGVHLLAVEAGGAQQQREAQEILSRFGGFDVSAAGAAGAAR